jgi:hypothetical protein
MSELGLDLLHGIYPLELDEAMKTSAHKQKCSLALWFGIV